MQEHINHWNSIINGGGGGGEGRHNSAPPSPSDLNKDVDAISDGVSSGAHVTMSDLTVSDRTLSDFGEDTSDKVSVASSREQLEELVCGNANASATGR